MSEQLPESLPLRGLANADGRRRPVQNYRRLRRQLIEDAGGPERISAASLATIDVLAAASAICREEFARYVTVPGHDPARLASLGNLVLGASRTLGLKREPKDAMTLAEYFEQRATQDAQQHAQDARSPETDANAAAQPSNAQEGAGAA